MTIEELSGILTRAEIKHAFDEDGDVGFVFESEKYTSPEGKKAIVLFIRLSNEGQMFLLTAHHAFVIKGAKHLDVFLKLCSVIQMSGYLVQFEYVPQNGSVRLCIEVPLADNKLTASQLRYCISCLVRTLEDFYEPLHAALHSGSLEGLPEEIRTAMAANESGDTTSL